jgi:putative FmdB family regulatory protein
MIYDFACDECRIVTQVERPVSLAGEAAACPVCGQDMRRLFYAPKLLNRSKPGTFKHDRCKLDGWADRVATLRNIEEKQGSRALENFRKNCGETLYNQSLQYRKEHYA